MPQQSVTVPVWLIVSVVVPAAVGLLAVLRWLGLREIRRWERQRNELEREIEKLKGHLSADHSEVEEKLDRLIEEVSAE
jgi:uncharacterized membrane-anchored protein YhcB (DUF1043 family)